MHSTNRRFLRKRYVIPSIAAAAALAGGGIAFAYFTSPGSGTGSASVGTPASLLIDQLGGTPMYNSRVDGTAYQYSQCFYCVQMGEFGNKVNLANGGGPLSDAVVDMVNFNPAAGTMPVTFNIYNTGPGNYAGSLIAADTQTFNVPAAPDGGYYGTACQTIIASNPTSDCGLAFFDIVFNFSSQNITLPGTVIYGIQYPDAQNSADSGVNPQLANESTQVTVGSDADPGYLFASLASQAANGYDYGYNDVGPGEITCSTVNTTFAEYSTATTPPGSLCGYGTPAYVPAVELDTSTMSGLYPGGPSQPVNFSITNTGSIPEIVSTVNIAVAYDVSNSDVEATPGYTSTDVAGCNAGWFSINASPVSATVTLGWTVPAGGTIDVIGHANISMPADSTDNQDACEGAGVGLTFTSA